MYQLQILTYQTCLVHKAYEEKNPTTGYYWDYTKNENNVCTIESLIVSKLLSKEKNPKLVHKLYLEEESK